MRRPALAPNFEQQCAELAPEEGAEDAWVPAARYAGAMLPGIFRADDPAVAVHFAPEGRDRLERILGALPPEVFTSEDALGWVYQFWQSEQKKRVNKGVRKIGAAKLAPVTQLFTEHYMVRFLLENSLGAWWAARHPESPLYGNEWSTDQAELLLSAVGFGGKGLEAWLRDGFFAQHCRTFHNRPVVWHVCDGRKDGFAALVNYHRLDAPALDNLIYTYLDLPGPTWAPESPCSAPRPDRPRPPTPSWPPARRRVRKLADV